MVLPDLAGARVLITGIAGFIGTRLARSLLACGAEVHGVLSPTSLVKRGAPLLQGLRLYEADLVDPSALRSVVDRVQPRYVVSLARRHPGPSLQEQEAAVGANITGVQHLLEATRHCGYKRLVHLGSATEYGPCAQPLQESLALAPRSLYGVTKAAGTHLCLQHARSHGLPIVVLRPFLVYGPGEPASRLVQVAVRAMLRGEEIRLTEPGCRRDWVFVDDVVEACLAALVREGTSGEVINAGAGQQWANEEVVALLESILGVQARVRVGACPRRPWDSSHQVADIDKARRLLGWTPRHPLPQGLRSYLSEWTASWH